jgi:iron complex outermembrane receptor protein
MLYRIQPATALSLSLSAFFNDYDDLLSIETGAPFLESSPPPPHIVIPIAFGNGLHGESSGLEVTSIVELAGWWRMTGAYSHVRIDLTPDVGSSDTSTARSTEGSSPRHQAFVHSSMNLPADFEFDWMFRAISELSAPTQMVSGYATSDVRLGRMFHKQVSLAIVGQNLHTPHHAEFVNGAIRTEVPRSVYGSIAWRW